MTREELKQEVQKWVNGADRYQMNLQSHLDYATNEIMKLVDKYVLSCVMKENEIKVNKIEPGQPLFPTPTCPSCGSKEYTISSNSAGNIRCSKCGKYFFFIFSRSLQHGKRNFIFNRWLDNGHRFSVFDCNIKKQVKYFYFKIRLVDLRILYHVSIHVFINW